MKTIFDNNLHPRGSIGNMVEFLIILGFPIMFALYAAIYPIMFCIMWNNPKEGLFPFYKNKIGHIIALICWWIAFFKCIL